MNLEELKTKLEEANQLYRTGGESPLSDAEYDYLLEQIKDETFRDRVGYEIEKNKCYVTASIGVSLYPKDSTEVVDLFKYADEAMYEIKKGSKGGFVLAAPYDPDQTTVSKEASA